MTPNDLPVRPWAAAGLAALLAGCVPGLYGTHYEPRADDPTARPLRAYCGGQAGPTTGLDFELGGGLRAQLDARGLAGDAPALDVEVRLPAGRRLQFAADAAELLGSGPVPVSVTVVVQAPLAAGAAADPSALLPGLAWGPESEASLSLVPRLPWADPAPSALRLALPPVQGAAGAPVVFAAELRGEPRGGWMRYYTAEERAALEDRVRRCEAGANPGRCAAVRDSYDNGLRLRDGGLELSGRVLRLDGAAPELVGYLALAWREPRAVRLGGMAVEVTDLAGGTSRQAPLGEPSLVVVHRGVGLATPFAPAAGSAGATLRLRVPVAAPGQPSYRLRLPAVNVDGRDYAPAVVHVERKAAGVTVEPFNC